jgi:hypothetical protein
MQNIKNSSKKGKFTAPNICRIHPDDPTGVQISEWVTYKGVTVRRECLPTTHPESNFQRVLGLGLNPLEYGFLPDEEHMRLIKMRVIESLKSRTS